MIIWNGCCKIQRHYYCIQGRLVLFSAMHIRHRCRNSRWLIKSVFCFPNKSPCGLSSGMLCEPSPGARIWNLSTDKWMLYPTQPAVLCSFSPGRHGFIRHRAGRELKCLCLRQSLSFYYFRSVKLWASCCDANYFFMFLFNFLIQFPCVSLAMTHICASLFALHWYLVGNTTSVFDGAMEGYE